MTTDFHDDAVTVMTSIKDALQGSPKVESLLGVAHTSYMAAHVEANTAASRIRDVEASTTYPPDLVQKSNEILAPSEEKAGHHMSVMAEALKAIPAVLWAEAMPKVDYDTTEQAFRRSELESIVSRSKDPVAELVAQTHNPRYAALAATDFGYSLLLGRGMTPHDVAAAKEYVQAEAMSWVEANGTPEQRKAVGRYALATNNLPTFHAAANFAVRDRLTAMRSKVNGGGAAIAIEKARREQTERRIRQGAGRPHSR